MAAKKKHHKKSGRKRSASGTKSRRRVAGTKSTRRRRRVGAHEKLKDAVLLAVGVGAGAVVTPFVVQAITTGLGSATSSLPGWMIPGGAFATGAVVAGAGLGKKSHLVTGFGAGMAAVGAVMTANEMGLNEPGIAGTAFSNNAAPGARAVTTSVGCRKRVGSPQRYVNTTVGKMSTQRARTMAIGALYSN